MTQGAGVKFHDVVMVLKVTGLGCRVWGF